MTRRAAEPASRAEDLRIWADYVRHVVPRPGLARPALPAPDAEAPAVPSAISLLPKPVARAAPVVVGMQPGGLDRASWDRLRDGRLRPTRRLDLHGRTAAAAHVALHDFLRTAVADGVRCVEVVTGHGMRSGGGAIRRELPLWLNLPALRPLVLALAYPHSANQGAVRILLRRRR